jgi:archaellum component FlaD/FlaE
MFDNFPRMFSTDDTDGEEEPDDETGLDDLEGLGGPTEEKEEEEDDGDDQGPDTEDLDVRLSELEEDIDTTESSLRSLRSSQEEMAASVEEMNDTIRQLAGMYDQIAAQQNPFVDDGEPGDVVGEPAEDGGDGVVSFEDLREEETDDSKSENGDYGSDTGNADRTEQDGAPASDTSEPSQHEPDHREPDHRQPAAAEEAAPAGTEREQPTPLLSSVPEGYAGDVLMMEWLAMLMDESGPAGALVAVEYYEDVGWISGETRDHLVNVIGGPALDVFVDPTRPREPTAEEHAESHGYLRVISQLREL